MIPCRILFVTVAISAFAAAPDGAELYKTRCAICHDGKPQARMPSRAEVAGKSPETVFKAMFEGAMVPQAAGLSEEEGRAIARYITAKDFASAKDATAGMCETPAKALTIKSSDWNGWGMDPGNSHYQPNPGLAAADVPKLKLKWAFGYPGDTMAFAQPTAVGGRIFVGSAGGTVYSLDAATGCTYWSYKAGASVRTAISIEKLGNRYVAFFGDVRAFAHAVEAETGKPLWKIKLDDHPVARITGAPAFYNGRVYVPVSSIEEVSGTSPAYECCKFRGSVVALDGETGKQLWKSYSVLDPPKAYKKNKNGVDLYGPAGAAVWSSPTIDTKRKLVYAATGNSYTDVDINTSDAVLAFELETGKLAWVSQVQPKDNFIVGCPNAINCPKEKGPDYDFGSSPVLRTVGGKQILIAGQKSGVVYGLDPNNKGKILWQQRLGKGSALGGVEWGDAADDKLAYVAVSDRIVGKTGTPGLYALDLFTGERKWGVPEPSNSPQSAAIAVMPGVVFSGALNGHFRAYAAATGEIIWDFETSHPFETVNKVTAKGGSIDASGPVIANGMVFTNSGYGQFGSTPGNVLLAFSVDGK